MREKTRQLFPILAALIFIIFANYLRTTRVFLTLSISKQESSLNTNSKLVSLFHFGQKRLISSFLWMKTLLDSDVEKYKKSDYGSWMYLRFKTISLLDPNFYEVYRYGGQYLSVVKDDPLGAKEIFENGVTKFPDDFWLNYYLAFHLLTEIHDRAKAIIYYQKLLGNPLTERVIPYLPSLIARIIAQNDEQKLAYDFLLKSYQAQNKDSPLSKKLHDNLYALKAELDLNCLNNHNTNCELLDFDQEPYTKEANNVYKAKQTWTPLKLYEKHRQ